MPLRFDSACGYEIKSVLDVRRRQPFSAKLGCGSDMKVDGAVWVAKEAPD